MRGDSTSILNALVGVESPQCGSVKHPICMLAEDGQVSGITSRGLLREHVKALNHSAISSELSAPICDDSKKAM
jgi:hypothetical protein